ASATTASAATPCQRPSAAAATTVEQHASTTAAASSGRPRPRHAPTTTAGTATATRPPASILAEGAPSADQRATTTTTRPRATNHGVGWSSDRRDPATPGRSSTTVSTDRRLPEPTEPVPDSGGVPSYTRLHACPEARRPRARGNGAR